MPVALRDYAEALNLPPGVGYRIEFASDTIAIHRDGKKIGSITRIEIDNNIDKQKLRKILDGEANTDE